MAPAHVVPSPSCASLQMADLASLLRNMHDDKHCSLTVDETIDVASRTPDVWYATRTCMVLVPASKKLVLRHANRTEEVEVGTMFGFDVTKLPEKEGSDDVTELHPLPDRNGNLVIRRIGKEAWEDCRWTVHDSRDKHTDNLVVEARQIMDAQNANDSYKEAWAHFMDAAPPHVYYSHCAIKIPAADVPMDGPEEERAALARLLAECDGKPTEGVSALGNAPLRRIFVCEPLGASGGGYPVNDKGERDEGGAYRGTSVYQKPIGDVGKDWIPLPREVALKRLHEAGARVPWELVRSLVDKIASLRESKDERKDELKDEEIKDEESNDVVPDPKRLCSVA